MRLKLLIRTILTRTPEPKVINGGMDTKMHLGST
jgi:hypothetical protein